MAHVPAQPFTGHRGHGPVRCPTLGFDLLYAFIIVRLARRELIWINVTCHLTTDWTFFAKSWFG